VLWRPNQLQELIDRLKSLVNGQFADHALCSRGDFSLQPQWVNYRQTVDVWSKMKPTQCEKCFRLQGLPTSTSFDEQLTITPGGGKKLHQKKRSRTHRTTTGPTRKIMKNEIDDEICLF